VPADENALSFGWPVRDRRECVRELRIQYSGLVGKQIDEHVMRALGDGRIERRAPRCPDRHAVRFVSTPDGDNGVIDGKLNDGDQHSTRRRGATPGDHDGIGRDLVPQAHHASIASRRSPHGCGHHGGVTHQSQQAHTAHESLEQHRFSPAAKAVYV